jgi:hypothetical protein
LSCDFEADGANEGIVAVRGILFSFGAFVMRL